MRRCFGIILASLAVAGCAHHQNQYAYAPPLAPPVYPQPQTVAAPALPPAAVAPVGVVPGPLPPVTATAPAVECCPPMAAGETLAQPVVYQEGQSPPCPAGP